MLLMIYQCFPNVRIGQRGPGCLRREEPLPDSSLPAGPEESRTPSRMEGSALSSVAASEPAEPLGTDGPQPQRQLMLAT